LQLAIRSRNNPFYFNVQACVMTIQESLKEYVILGMDAIDVEVQKAQWLAENPQVRVTETSDIEREPPSLLVRFGGKGVPRFSVLLRYRQEDEAE
jgi:hypothetical protein